MTIHRQRYVSIAIVAAVAFAASASVARAQLSFPGLTNSSNPDETVPGTATIPIQFKGRGN